MSNTALRAALSAAIDLDIDDQFLDMMNIILSLLEIVSWLAPTFTDIGTTRRSFIIRAF